ncbi:MAG: NUDIX hydrolase [Candidatus Azobacteroides sp.]|nr:NUDIX hydrolase [Candidatus Azobacteroides sp.]
MEKEKELLRIAQRIRALSQTGLVYNKDEYSVERYEELLALSHEITSLVTGHAFADIKACFRVADDYVTPKVDIRAVVFNETGEILLVREKADGCWSLPGGWADVGFTPGEVAEKEVKEETGLIVKAKRLLAVMDKKYHAHPPALHYAYKIFILCEITDGNFTTTFDILDKGFFSQEALPPLSEERVLESQIDLMFEYRNNLEKDVYFD